MRSAVAGLHFLAHYFRMNEGAESCSLQAIEPETLCSDLSELVSSCSVKEGAPVKF